MNSLLRQKFTYEQARETLQASDTELDQGLTKRRVLIVNGAWDAWTAIALTIEYPELDRRTPSHLSLLPEHHPRITLKPSRLIITFPYLRVCERHMQRA